MIKSPSSTGKVAQAKGTKTLPKSGGAEANYNSGGPKELKTNHARYLKAKVKSLLRSNLRRMPARQSVGTTDSWDNSHAWEAKK